MMNAGDRCQSGRMRALRKADVYLCCLTAAALLFGLLFVDSHFRKSASAASNAERRALVRSLQLTDLSLFTEARYTRHLSQADLHSAFQDHPLSAEHFPAGSFTASLKKIRIAHEKMD